MQEVRVKICGITNSEDAAQAAGLGADALGFLVELLYPTDDQLALEVARDLVRALPPFISSVLVTHRAAADDVARLVEAVQPNTLQLHGASSVTDILDLRRRFPLLKIIKAVHVQGEGAIAAALAVAPFVDGVLLDTKTDQRLGGTGMTHDWSISRKICRALAGKPVILAGGLNPANVRSAIETVEPYGVDVNTGVSQRPGKKSAALLSQFITNAKLNLADTRNGKAEAVNPPAIVGADELRTRFR